MCVYVVVCVCGKGWWEVCVACEKPCVCMYGMDVAYIRRVTDIRCSKVADVYMDKPCSVFQPPITQYTITYLFDYNISRSRD